MFCVFFKGIRIEKCLSSARPVKLYALVYWFIVLSAVWTNNSLLKEKRCENVPIFSTLLGGSYQQLVTISVICIWTREAFVTNYSPANRIDGLSSDLQVVHNTIVANYCRSFVLILSWTVEYTNVAMCIHFTNNCAGLK